MKYFIISDSHGHYTEMKSALDKAGFDSENPDHHLVIAGDLFDRGTENVHILNYVYDLLEKDKITLIKGNHDEFFYDLNNMDWNIQHNGFNTTVNEFLEKPIAGNAYTVVNKIMENQPKLQPVLSSMIDSLKIDNYVITHGGLNKDGQPDNWNNVPRWITRGNSENDGNIYIFGHWHAYDLNQRFLGKNNLHAPFVYENYIGIDNAVALTGEMFVYIIEDKQGESYEQI